MVNVTAALAIHFYFDSIYRCQLSAAHSHLLSGSIDGQCLWLKSETDLKHFQSNATSVFCSLASRNTSINLERTSEVLLTPRRQTLLRIRRPRSLTLLWARSHGPSLHLISGDVHCPAPYKPCPSTRWQPFCRVLGTNRSLVHATYHSQSHICLPRSSSRRTI